MAEEDLAEAIRKLFAEKMLVEVASADEDLIQSGALDSLRLAELLLHLEDDFGLLKRAHWPGLDEREYRISQRRVRRSARFWGRG